MKQTILFMYLLLITACAPAVPYNQMPGGGDLYSDANSNRMTADAAIRQAQWQEQALTQTAVAPIVRITETAAAVAVQETQAYGTSQAAIQTQAASWTGTAVMWTPTPNVQSTATFAALNAQNTQIANNLERDRLQLAREQTMNDFNAKVSAYSWVILVLVIALVLMLITRKWRYQPAKVDARGNVLPILDIVDGVVTDPDRNPNYQGSISQAMLGRILMWWVEKKLGIPPLLPPIDAKRQDETTQRDQLLDLASRGLPEHSSGKKEVKQQAGQEMLKQISDTNLQSRFQILDPSNAHLGVIDGEIIEVLDQEWKEAGKK